MAHEVLVHVIDDDEAVRDSITFLLQSSKIPVRSYASASEFLDQMESIEASCIITDVRMPDIDGIELVRRVADRRPEIPVIVITGHGDIALALEAMKAGAVDFIEKPFEHEALLRPVQASLGEPGVDDEQRRTIQERFATLSPVEQKVLQGLTAGRSNKEIATTLQIGSPQVEVHRASIMTKMQARGLSHLIRMLLQVGYPLF
jgi:two-component system response regulator FixJ